MSKKWEYTWITISKFQSDDLFAIKLKKMGDDGWEAWTLVGSEAEVDTVFIHFKREKE